MAEADLAAVAREAHSLAGMAGNTGAMQTMELARQLEAAALSGRQEALASLVAAAGEAADAADAAIRTWLERDENLANNRVAG